ncbi:PE family protein [Mycolicibacterium aubagnense]|uniref:PE family protein PE35 n=1 Tax=Mycolicibacterium aubagnense TaxID=319707 RepID=A0ABM7IFX4_9MYCO|nr:PE family protein [Mycolicibacterium aubagnense]TLH70744.1 PE family protein [Mycolicibacterium aubagnense]BBX85598.1 putative PE family protein PE35 [Mycolicibacterium aubagnense]
MQPLEHNPGAIGVGTQVVGNGARGLTTGTATLSEASALVPAGADEVSMQAAMAFAVEGVEVMGINAFAQEELARAGAAYVEAGAMYEATDVATAATLI